MADGAHTALESDVAIASVERLFELHEVGVDLRDLWDLSPQADDDGAARC